MRLYDRFADAPADGAARGIWLAGDDEPVVVETADIGPATVLVPSELVLILAIDLPLPSRARRLAALPFAIEDAIATPVDAVHLALGAEITPRRHLAGVVAPELMRRWLDQLDAAGLGHASLVPDALALPQPPAGLWSIDLTARRALVRLDDGTGFAVPAERLGTVWTMGGSPPCLSYGDALPKGMTLAEHDVAIEPLAQRLLHPPLDLRQGAFAREHSRLSPVWRRLAIALGAGLLAHTAIAAADTVALHNIAAKREAETRALVAQVAPDLAASDDLVSVASGLLPSGSAAASPFFPLLSRASVALKPLASQVTIRDLSWSAADGALSMDLDAPDLATLQRVQAALDAAGLKPEAGAAAAGDNSAEGKVTIRDPAGGRS